VSGPSKKKIKQSRLEQEMVDLGIARYNHKVKRAAETNLESTTGVGQRLLSESVSLMTDHLKSWLKTASAAPGRRHRAHEPLSQLPPDVVSGLTARCILDCISTERKIASMANTIGRTIEDEIKFRHIKENEPALWEQIQRSIDNFKSSKTKSKFINKTINYHDLVIPSWDRKISVSVGLTCIELFRQATGTVEIITRTDQRGRAYTIVLPTDDLVDWFKNCHEFNESLNPVWMPMVERPVDWTNPYIGGYQSTGIRRKPIVKTYDKAYLDELAACDLGEVYKSVNILQRTGFRVRGFNAELYKHCWHNNLPIGGMPTAENEPLPPKPADIKTNKDSRIAWRRAAARVHFNNERQKSKRIQTARTCQLLDKFTDETFYYVVQGDHRFRGYYLGHPLQPHAAPCVRYNLEFDQGMKINDEGLKWLYINTANKWGLDKEPYEKRIKWVEENLELVERVGRDPVGEMIWADADDPFGFASSCHEILNFRNNGSDYISHMPVGLDGTNQGLGIIGMLMRDVDLAKECNVLDSKVPGDPYRSVSDNTRRLLYEDVNNEYAKKWLEFGVDRKTTKRPTMTLSYGSTLYSCREYTVEWFYEQLKSGKENPFGAETYRPCHYLADQIWQSISEVVGSALVLMSWLRSVARLCVEYDVIPRWTTPQGFPVKMRYEKQNKYAVKTLVNGTVLNHRINIPNGQANMRKTINAIVANFIHSLDGIGGILGRTLNMGYDAGIMNVFAIHDEINVHASNVDKLGRCVRESTAEIFSENILDQFAQTVSVLLPPEADMPQLPVTGKLNIDDVKCSKYYWN
jgi:DNA-directed RNA polymerase